MSPTAPADTEPVILKLNVPEDLRLQVTPEQFEILAARNKELRLELTAAGELIVASLVDWKTSARNVSLCGQLYEWNEANDRPGVGFGSCTGFTMPNGAVLSPDVSWVSTERWEALAPDERETFAPLCPDFVAELRPELGSASDSIAALQAKLREYLDNGARLGWLLDPQNRTAEIYRPDREVEILDNPATLSGENVLPGFTLELPRIWG